MVPLVCYVETSLVGTSFISFNFLLGLSWFEWQIFFDMPWFVALTTNGVCPFQTQWTFPILSHVQAISNGH
jgi:hypothetical protein